MRSLLRFLAQPKFRKWLIATPIVFVAFSIGSVELTSQSFFCNSCHIMNPYYESWKKGTHKDVECVECHISPGATNFISAKLNGLGQVVDDVLNRTSTKPSASVSQFACTRSGCHTIEKVQAGERNNGPYKFKHEKHLGLDYKGVAVSCGTCHSHVKGEDHFKVNTSICITCHLIEKPGDPVGDSTASAAGKAFPATIRLAVRETPPGESAESLAPRVPGSPDPALLAEAPTDTTHAKLAPTSCKTCHTPPEGTIERNGLKVDHAQFLSYGASCESCHRGTTAPPEAIEDGRCLQCHTFGVDRSLPAEQMHRVHNEGKHKIECFSCHGEVRHGPNVQTASMEQFDCKMCHRDQHVVQRRTYLAKDQSHSTESSPAMSPMFMAHVSCNGCHIHDRPVSVRPDSGATVAEAVAEACDRCHKPGMGKQMIPLWQKTTRKMYDQIAAELSPVLEQDLPVTDTEQLRLTQSYLELIRVDGSWGVHNPRYTQQLLLDARESFARAMGKPVPPRPAPDPAATTYPPEKPQDGAEKTPGTAKPTPQDPGAHR